MVLVVVAGVITMSEPSGGGDSGYQGAPDREAYLSMVGRYCDGGLESVAADVTPLTHLQLAPLVDLLLRTLEPKTRAAAAAMHTEVTAARWGSGIVLRADPRFDLADPHFDLAKKLAARSVGGDDAGLTRRWSLAMGYLLLSYVALPTAERHLAAARQSFPGDPDVLVASGSLHEIYTQPLGRQVLARSGRQRGGSPSVRLEHRVRAAGFYRDALAVEPNHAEAHLRLGRLALVAGSREEAERELSWVVDHGSHAWLLYLGHLFLGELYEQDGRMAEAEAHYEIATNAWPGAQTAALALAVLRARSGTAGAIGRLGPRFDGSQGPPHRDPWHDYLFSSLDRFQSAVDALRALACS